MKLYDKDGWLDIPHVVEVADKNNISFIIIIGKRQVGKTYGVLKYMLDEDVRFMLLRGMKTELEMLERNVNSPFEKIKGYEGKIIFSKDSEYTANIKRLDSNGENDTYVNIGMGAALSSIGRIRGFNGDIYTDIVYDEFIPESHLLKVRHAGDAFTNMYTTVSGNRELEGRAPLRVWLLANSNNLDNEILDTLQVTDIIERMSLKGTESAIFPDRGIMILLPDSTVITQKRKQTALFKAIDSNSKFARMAYGNEFAYNDYSDVSNKPLQEYRALFAFNDCVLHLHKNDKSIYITSRYGANCNKTYTNTDYDKMIARRNYPELKIAYLDGRITFQNMTVKNKFLNYFEFDN